MTPRVAITGATGRMGALAAALIDASDHFTLGPLLNSTSDLELLHGADIVLDFTTPSASPAIVRSAVRAGADVVVGTSGWGEDAVDALRGLLDGYPERGVLIVPNFSVGSIVSTHLAAIAGRFFDSIEIIEAHHAGKIDSPSGTAVRTAELIASSRAKVAEAPVAAPHVEQRARGELVAGIPIHSLRLAGVVASQKVVFGGTGEFVTIGHDTTDPHSYDQGIELALGAVQGVTGVRVGLGAILGLS